MAFSPIKLNGLLLPPQTRWLEQTKSTNVYAEVTEGLTGHKVVRTGRISNGVTITLSCSKNEGVFTHEQVAAIQAMHDVIDATYALEIDNKIIQVRFAHESPPAWEYTAFWGLVDLSADVGFNGAIKLITV